MSRERSRSHCDVVQLLPAYLHPGVTRRNTPTDLSDFPEPPHGNGLAMVYKRFEEQGLVWPAIRDGVMTPSRTQFEAQITGLGWRRV